MARARAIAIEHPAMGFKKAMDATAESIKAGARGGQRAAVILAKGTAQSLSKGLYYTFYGATFLTTFVLLTAYGVVKNNPIGEGIKDGAIAAKRVTESKKTKKSK